MKKILAAALAAATFASTLSFGVSATAIDSNTSLGLGHISTLNMIFVEEGNQHDTDTVYPGKSIFIYMDDFSGLGGLPGLTDKDEVSLKLRVVEGAKHSAGVSYYVSKPEGKKLINLTGSYLATTAKRRLFIEVKLKDNFTSDENKIRLELTVKGKNGPKYGYTGSTTVTSPYIYVGNDESGPNTEYEAGTGGTVYKPEKNDDNEIVWYDMARDIATLRFFADSDVAKSYPKLSTKWSESDYGDYFAEQDAFLFDFISNPYVSATSRATLEIVNPYYDEEGDTTRVDPENVIIYQIVEDELVDVTDKFKYDQNEDGDYVFSIKTRQLGTYIFAEAEATAQDVAEDEVVETPDDVKRPVDTGR